MRFISGWRKISRSIVLLRWRNFYLINENAYLYRIIETFIDVEKQMQFKDDLEDVEEK